ERPARLRYGRTTKPDIGRFERHRRLRDGQPLFVRDAAAQRRRVALGPRRPRHQGDDEEQDGSQDAPIDLEQVISPVWWNWPPSSKSRSTRVEMLPRHPWPPSSPGGRASGGTWRRRGAEDIAGSMRDRGSYA